MFFNGFVVLSRKVLFAFSDIPMGDESDPEPLDADFGTPPPRKQSPTDADSQSSLADSEYPPDSRISERSNYFEADPLQYRQEIAGEFKIWY
jgi:hypothetical protein